MKVVAQVKGEKSCQRAFVSLRRLGIGGLVVRHRATIPDRVGRAFVNGRKISLRFRTSRGWRGVGRIHDELENVLKTASLRL